MRKFILGVFLILFVSVCHAEEAPSFDQYGGMKSIHFGATGFFHTHQEKGTWWLVTPEGNAFLSIGVCHATSDGDAERNTGRNPYAENIKAKYGDNAVWAEKMFERFQEWNVNTLGAWSSGELNNRMTHTIILSLGSSMWRREGHADFFDPAFEESLEKSCASLGANKDDPFLLGYFLDNELAWAPDWRMGPELFDAYMAMPTTAPGKQKLLAFFQERYPDFNAFLQVWRVKAKSWEDLEKADRLFAHDKQHARQDCDDFTLLAARKYFELSCAAVRKVDPNHLILGCRFIWQTTPRAVIQAAGEYCDVVSTNCYEAGPLGTLLLNAVETKTTRMPKDYYFSDWGELIHKPLLITEFGFRAMDSGCPNSFPPPILIQPNVETQGQRFSKYQNYVSHWIAQPFVVGFHWFKYMDQPPGGRFDGENGNYGLVNIEDEPYLSFVTSFAALNLDAWNLHQK